jgi:hypothetical protein
VSVDGRYELELECDHVTPSLVKQLDPGPPNVCGQRQVFIDDTRFAALEIARLEGWLIGRKKQAFCPTHAADRRASWR